MKIAFFTLGCKVNQYETQAVRELFLNNGYALAEGNDIPDVFIINSCTVTAESDRKTRQAVRKFRAKYPYAVVVLMGCMPQSAPDAIEALPEADIVIGNCGHKLLPALVDEFLKTGERIVRIDKHKKGEGYSTPDITDFCEHTRAFMKIEDGCDRYCTYCVIPYARGFVRSKSLDDIRAEAESLALKGFLEVVLVGINLSSFGKDSGNNLYDAVKTVCDVEGIQRVRLGSLEPDLMSDDLLVGLSKLPKFCPQFHLSLQSGCDATLKRMNRHYDTSFYYDLVKRIRKIFPDASITTDIMVGFAGESEEEFSQTLEFVKKVGFAKSHIFAYSRRRGTAADKMPGHLSNSVKAQRSRKMINLTQASEHEFLVSQCGKTASVLFETEENGEYLGNTKNYTPVKVKSDINLCGKIYNVKITSVFGGFCLGEIIK